MTADKIISDVLTEEVLLEMPQYFPGQVTYRKDSKFTPISKGNYSRYQRLYQDDKYAYMLGPFGSFGMVFLLSDIDNPPPLGMVPVMTVELRDSPVKGYKQAYGLRIRQDFSHRHVASTWYAKYVERMGGIVSDFEHLEGGKAFWRSLVNTAADRGLIVSLYDTKTGQSVSVGAKTPDLSIWSKDTSKKHLVLVLEKP